MISQSYEKITIILMEQMRKLRVREDHGERKWSTGT